MKKNKLLKALLLISVSCNASSFDLGEVENKLGLSIILNGGEPDSVGMLGLATSDCSDAIQAEGQSRNGDSGWRWTSFGKHFDSVAINEKTMILSGNKFQLIYGNNSPFRYEDQKYTCAFKYDADDFSGEVIKINLDRT